LLLLLFKCAVVFAAKSTYFYSSSAARVCDIVWMSVMRGDGRHFRHCFVRAACSAVITGEHLVPHVTVLQKRLQQQAVYIIGVISYLSTQNKQA